MNLSKGTKPVFEHTYYISSNTDHSYPVGSFKVAPLVKEIIRQNMESRGETMFRFILCGFLKINVFTPVVLKFIINKAIHSLS